MKRLFLAITLCTYSLILWAVPAKRITMTVEQPDGTVLILTQKGDEFFHYLTTEDGRMVKSNGKGYYYADIEDGRIVPSQHLAHALALRSEKEQHVVDELPSIREFCELVMQREETAQRVRATRAAQKVAEVPTTGDVKIPVLLVQYTDVKFSSSDPLAAFEGHINGENYKDEGGYGSVREYFEDQSERKFTPTFDIIGPITLPYAMSHYGGNDQYGNDKDPRGMIEDACKRAGADFSQYDNDGDGYVDIVYVIYAGYGEASYPDKLEDTIWPHQWTLEKPLTMTYNGNREVKISKYACNNELDGYQGNTIDGIGTFCHEFSHCLGLPDFYPTGEDQSPFGMESWSLMHYGCYNNNGHTPCGYTGYELDFLGWRDLIVLDNPQDVKLTPLSEGGRAYKIVNDANPDEYYVVENHQKSKWDSFAPAEGMLVLHVDYAESAWLNNTVNNSSSHQRMTVIPADNRLTRDSQSGDTYPGTTNNTELTSSSKPAAKVFEGEYMNKDITNISINEHVVTFSFMKGQLPAPQNATITNTTNSSFSLTWDEVAEAEEYEVVLEYLEENPYLLEEDFNKVKKGNQDIGTTLDSYTNSRGWMGQLIYGLDGAIRVGNSSSVGILMSPNFTCDSSSVTIVLGFKKCEESDAGSKVLIGIGDQEWGNSLIGGFLTVTNENWETCVAVIDSIGKHPFFYLDTRGDATKGLGTCADIDYIYLLPGNRSEELTNGAENSSAARTIAKGIEVELKNQIQHTPLVRLSCDDRHEPTSALQRATAGSGNEQYKSSNGKKYYRQVIHTARTADCCYHFEQLDSGFYACAVRSVCGEIYSRYTPMQEIALSGDDLPLLEFTPYLYIDKDSLYMEVKDSVTLYYTTDGSVPTKYGNRYDAPLYLGAKTRVRVIAHQKGYKSSAPTEKLNWFKQEDATYRIISEITPEVSLSEAVNGNTQADYVGCWMLNNSIEHNDVNYAIVGIDSAAFSNATALRSIEIASSSLRYIGNNLFHGCTALNAVVWDTELPIHDTMFDEGSYHNLLIYTADDVELAHPLINEGRMTQVSNGTSGKLTLEGSYPFYCPRAFTAESVSYRRSFAQTTGSGDAAGWETIVLPFDVQSFSHVSKGEVAPFGVKAKHNFWLAELTDKGFSATTMLRANVPYIIAMPNNTEYGSNSLSGAITFSATHATIQPTDELTQSAGKNITLIPTYESVAPSADIYVLNVGNKFDVYKPGSVFVPNKYTASPFSAYVVPSEAHKAAPLFRIQKEEHIADVAYTFSVKSQNGVVYITLPEAKVITVYDITGRKVCNVACEMGVNEITGLSEGIYLIENLKIFVKH